MFTLDALLSEKEVTAEHRLAVTVHLFRIGVTSQARLDERAKEYARELGQVTAKGKRPSYVSRAAAISRARLASPFSLFPGKGTLGHLVSALSATDESQPGNQNRSDQDQPRSRRREVESQ